MSLDTVSTNQVRLHIRKKMDPLLGIFGRVKPRVSSQSMINLSVRLNIKLRKEDVVGLLLSTFKVEDPPQAPT